MIGKANAIYIASPLFSQAEKDFNEELCSSLENVGFQVFLPQRDGLLYSDLIASGVASEVAKQQVFSADVLALSKCDLLVAVLDGRAIDEGVAFEIGFAYAHGKYIASLQTDPRRIFAAGNNPMLDCSCAATYVRVSDLVRELLRW